MRIFFISLTVSEKFLQPLVARFLNRGLTKSLIRTTTAVTMFHGGVKVNVIPPSAWAIVNHRIHTKQTVEEVRVVFDFAFYTEMVRGFYSEFLITLCLKI